LIRVCYIGASPSGTAVALAVEVLGLTEFVPGFPPDLGPDTAAVDANIAEQPCYFCGAEGGGRALPFHSEEGRSRLLVLYSCCGTIGEP
jgi:hypothetical protein